MSEDLPYYETFYGIKIEDWSWSYGAGYFNDTHYVLVKEYINEGCETEDYSELTTSGSNVFEFFFPHYIKRRYFIEGTIIGHFTLSCINGDSEIDNYSIDVYKINDTGSCVLLGTTDTVIPVNKTFDWDSQVTSCTERVYPFEIEITPEKEMLEDDRLFIRLTINTNDTNTVLYHSNDAQWEDFKIQIPFRGL